MWMLTLAWRNVGRNTRRAGVTVAAMAFSAWVAILYAGLMEGWMSGMERDVLDLQIGDVQVHPAGWAERPSLWSDVPEAARVVADLRADGYRASTRSMTGGIAGRGEASAGVQIRGVEAEGEGTVSRLPLSVTRGSWLDPADPRGVVLGARLARMLSAEVGDEVLILSQARDGSTANDLVRVRGVLSGVGSDVDRAGLFMDLAAFSEFVGMPGEVAHEIVVRRRPNDTLDALKAEVAGRVPGAEVASWREILPIAATAVDSARQMIWMTDLVVYLAVGILLLNAMLMAVFERIREIGVLKALGLGPAQVFVLVLMEVSIQVAMALVIAGVAAVPTAWMISTWGIPVSNLGGISVMGVTVDTSMKGIYTPEVVLPPVLLIVVVMGLAAVWPAWRASSLNPVQAMRHR